jgi:phosphonate transport system substrate-binding protein
MGQLLMGQVAAAGVNHQVMAEFAKRKNIKYRVLSESELYFDLAVMASPRVSAEDGEKIRRAFVGMSSDAEGQRVLQQASAALDLDKVRGFVRADDRDYTNYRDFFKRTRLPLNE